MTTLLSGCDAEPFPSFRPTLDGHRYSGPRRSAWQGLYSATGLQPLTFEHIGSTAVPGLIAKPIIDFMAGHPRGDSTEPYVAVLVAAGYELEGHRACPTDCSSSSVPRRIARIT